MSLGTWIYTLINGAIVGKDEFGNKYYRGKGRKLNGRERRWVVYKGNVEASKVPPEWHAWLHFTVDEPLTVQAAQARPGNKHISRTRRAHLMLIVRRGIYSEAVTAPPLPGITRPGLPNS